MDIDLQKLFFFSSMNSGSVCHSGWLFINLSRFFKLLILVPVESVVMPSPLFLILIMPICLFFFLISFLEQKFINFVDLTVLGVTDFSVSFFFQFILSLSFAFLGFHVSCYSFFFFFF